MIAEHSAMIDVLEKEFEAIAKFLKDKVKLRPTLLMHKIKIGVTEKDMDMPIDYCLGKDIHFTVISHRVEILAMAKEIQKRKDLKGLESIGDSIVLLDGLMTFKKLVKIGPSRLQYPDPKAADAKRPKRVDVLPVEK